MPTTDDQGYKYVNICMTSTTHPDGVFNFPSDWKCATGTKFIIVREAFAAIMNPHKINDGGGEDIVGNITLHGSFVWEPYFNNYICIVNSEPMKKKRFEVLGTADSFRIWFEAIDGTKIYPSSWLFDGLLKFKP